MNALIGRILGAALVAAMLAGCGGGTNGTAPIVPHAPAHARKPGHIKFAIRIPSHKRMQALRRKRKPHYLPDSVTEIDFNLVNPADTNPPTYSFTILPSTDARCTAESGGYDCENIVEPAPAGTDTYQIVACVVGDASNCSDSADGAVVVSEANVQIVVSPAEQATCGSSSCTFTLNPIVSGLQFSSGTQGSGSPDVQIASPFANGPNTPTWTSGVGYSCAYGSCYDPLINDNSDGAGNNAAPAYDPLALNLVDQEGAVIVPSVGSISSSPYMPIYLAPNGDELDVAMWCPDSGISWLAYYTSVPKTRPSEGAGDLQPANGFSSPYVVGGVDGTFYSNSPYVNGNNYGTVFSTGAESNVVLGNNGGYVNFDGYENSYGTTPIECAAVAWDGTLSGYSYPSFNQPTFPYTSATLLYSAPYYVGPALGDGTVVIDGRHRTPARRPKV